MIKDWSTEHQPCGKLLTLPTSKAEWERYALSEEQIAFFNENGYLQGLRMLDEEQIEILREELNELVNPSHPAHHLFYEFNSNESEDPHRILFHALGAWRIMSGFHDLVWHPAFTVPASQILGGAVRLWHDQLFCKPAHHGGVVAWHQDYSYWTRTKPLAHLTCWIGLDDSTVANGCLHYVPGSHLWDDLPKPALAGNMDAIQDVLSEEQKELFKPVAIELKKGEFSIHHPRMIHGSFANDTERPRRGAVINVLRDGVRSDSNEPLLEGIPVIAKGEKLAGQFFPVLFDPAEFRS